MHTRTRLLLGALVTALALSAAVSTASARRIELSNQFFRAVWNPNVNATSQKLTFAEPSVGVKVICNVTIEGSFHSRTLSKVCGQLIGYVTRAGLETCEGGSAIILNGAGGTPQTLPWHIRYDSFTGTLPAIETIRLQLIEAAFLLEIAFGSCLFQSNAASPAFGRVNIEAGVAQTLTAEPNARIPLSATLAGLCPGSGTFSGNSIVRLLGSTTTRINVRLVQ